MRTPELHYAGVEPCSDRMLIGVGLTAYQAHCTTCDWRGNFYQPMGIDRRTDALVNAEDEAYAHERDPFRI